MQVNPINVDEFQVQDNGVNEVVNINKRTCTCNYWQMNDFPCSHAMATMWKNRLQVMSFISRYYTKDFYIATYSASLYPIDDMSSWDIPSELLKAIKAPIVVAKAGRPKMKRYASSSIAAEQMNCSNCGAMGHNKRSCLKKH